MFLQIPVLMVFVDIIDIYCVEVKLNVQWCLSEAASKGSFKIVSDSKLAIKNKQKPRLSSCQCRGGRHAV